MVNNNYCSIEDAWGSLVEPVQNKDKRKKKKVRDPICDLYEMSTSGNYNELDMVKASNDFEKYNKSKYQRDRQAGREKNKYVTIDASMFEDKDFVPLYKQNASDDMDLEKQFNTAIHSAQCSKTKGKNAVKLPDLESHFNPITQSPDDGDGDDESDADFTEFKNILDKKMQRNAPVIPDDQDQEDYQESDGGYDEDIPVQTKRVQSRGLKAQKQQAAVEEQFVDDDFMPKQRSRNNMSYLDLMLYIVSGVILIFVMEQFVKIGVLLQT